MSQKTEEKSLTLYDEQPTLSFDVAREMKKGYDIVNDVIEKLLKDTRVEEIKDGKGKIIGQRTHVNPQLLAWIRESRLTKNDPKSLKKPWKIGKRIVMQVEKIINMISGKTPRYIRKGECRRCGACCLNENCQYLKFTNGKATCLIHNSKYRPNKCKTFPQLPPIIFKTCGYYFIDRIDGRIIKPGESP